MSTPNEDSIGHTPEWYRRQLKIAQARIRELEAQLQEAQAEITTLRAKLEDEKLVNWIASEMEAERQGLVMS